MADTVSDFLLQRLLDWDLSLSAQMQLDIPFSFSILAGGRSMNNDTAGLHRPHRFPEKIRRLANQAVCKVRRPARKEHTSPIIPLIQRIGAKRCWRNGFQKGVG